MPNETDDALVVCPYFARFHRGKNAMCQIICEGIAAGTESGVIFTGRDAMHRWTVRYCNTYDYDRCPMAAAIGGKK